MSARLAGATARCTRVLATRLLVALALSIAIVRPAPAQIASGGRVAFDRIAQERGLSSGTVTAIVQDRAGLLWFGTEDGLDRYAGAGFTTFRPVNGDTTSIADGWITGLAVARDGALWVSTLHGGVQRYDAAAERFRRYRHVDGDPTTLSSDRVNTVVETRDGAIWAGTVSGLDRLDPATGRVRHYAIAPGDSTALANDILALAEADRGRLWVGGRTGPFLFDPARGTFAPVGGGRDGAAAWYPIRAILADGRGRTWIATENALVAVDPTTLTVTTRYGQPTATRPSPIGGRVMALAMAPDGALLVGSDGGLTWLDPTTGAYHRHTYDRADAHSLGGNIVRAVLADRGHVVWAGLESYGISKFTPSAVRFGILRHDPADPNSLSDGYVRGMTRDRAGDLWIATQFGGLDRFDARTGRITVYRQRPNDPRSLPADAVWAPFEDHAGTFWVGTHFGGLGTLDRRTGAFTRFPLVPADAKVNVIVEDRAGRLLVGLEGLGLVEISADRRHARTYGATRGDVRTLANDDVQTILEDRTGVLWIGGVDGLTRLDRRTGAVHRYRGVPGRPGALGTDFVTHVMEDRAGTVWVATKGAGIARWDARTDRFTTIGVAEGLPHAFVYGMLEDAHGRLWLGTDDGIAAYDPRTGAIARYGLADGLQAREFNRRAFYRAADGTMYFGGINGVNVFNPDAVAPSTMKPRLAIVSLQPTGAGAHHLVGAIDTTVRLRHDESGFTIAFAALDYAEPEKVRFAYRLEGVDRAWVLAGDRREVSYASVGPGRYVFRVIAASASGVWNRDGATLTIVVAPPWWATWWARLTALLLAGAVVAGTIHLRLLAAHRQSARLARRVDEQTRDLIEAKERLRVALERERAVARELGDVTAAVPGAVFRLREDADGRRSFPFMSEGIMQLFTDASLDVADEDPRVVAERLLTRIHPDDVDAIVHSLAASRADDAPWRAEFRIVAPDGTFRWIEAHARPTRDGDATVWTGVLTDTTAARRADAERAALEARVLRAQKAESLAVLAGGIAHDFNNLLVGVLANADLLEGAVPPRSEAAETVGLIRESALRASELTQQMLAYAGRGRLIVERVDLAVLVRDMTALVRSAVPRTIRFDVRAEVAHVPVEADATQLRQVVMNLATNAAEAIGDRAGGGSVAVRVAIEHAPQAALALQHAADDMPEQGPYAVLEVHDDGCGMDPSVLCRIFDPFFSTKFTGRGLGLAALLGVVRAHHGGLRVATHPGRGSRFTLFLPLAAASASAPTPAAAPMPNAEPEAMRPTRVLVVDDEPAVLRTAARILRAVGHDVVTATDGTGALATLAGDPGVDAVVLDMTMPGMTGLQTAAAMRERGLTAPVVLMSGYSAEEIAGNGAGTPSATIDAFLKKPFTSDEMRAAIAAVTEAARR